MKNKIIVALDVNTKEKAQSLVQKLAPTISHFKIGKELFAAIGPDIVKMVHDQGSKVFLDLKFHDIPNTVRKAIDSVQSLNVWMCNVHTLGGREMMQAASRPSPLILGVTILTSMNEDAMKEVGLNQSAEAMVIQLATLAKDSGLSGVVASAKEAKAIRNACGKDFLIVTPGVRPSWAAAGDQKRVVTPKEAIENGADYVVIGRPITEQEDAAEAAQKIIQEMET